MPKIRFDKRQVRYTDHGTEQEHCSICRHYLQPHRCEIVRGIIRPEGWCAKFAAKDRKP